MNTLLPTNLNLTEHLLKYPPTEILAFSTEKLQYVIGLPFTIMAGNKDLRTGNGYVPIHAKTLKEQIGNNVRQYLGYLKRTGIFETNNQYIAGETSRQFRIAKEYRGSYTEVELNGTLAKKFKKKSREEIKKQEKQPEYQKVNHLRKWIFNGKLQLDLELAKTVLNEMFLKGKVKLYEDSEQLAKQRRMEVQRTNKAGDKGCSEKVKLTYRERQILKYYRNLHAAERLANIQDNVPYFKVDDKVFRLHSSATGLKRELRKCLTYDGKTLFEVDVAVSQPYFSLVLLSPGFWGLLEGEKRKVWQDSDKFLNNCYMSSVDNIYLNCNKSLNKPSITLQKLIKQDKCLLNDFNKIYERSFIIMVQDMVKDIDKEELSHYTEQVTSGKLYNYLLDKYIEQTGKKDMSRDKMKKVIFTILFSKNENEILGNSKKEEKIREQRILAKEIFRSCYPTIMRVFEKIKEGQNNLLALLLQTIEASVVLDKICWRIKRERPGLPLITIHDSILTTSGNETYVKRIMEEEFEKTMGIMPKLDKKDLAPFIKESKEEILQAA